MENTTVLLVDLMMENKTDVQPPSSSYFFAFVSIFLLLAIEFGRRSVVRSSSKSKARLSYPVQGHYERGYERIREAFSRNFELGWEKSGAAVAVYHRGKLVADLYGGYADFESRRLWRENTLAAVASLCIAVLIDRGHLAYDDLVVKYWPKFGKHGKDKITIQHVLSHMAGLAYLDSPIKFEDAQSNPDEIARLFEEQKPNWIPGEQVGYHAITFGWLIDQIIRRADPQHRSLGQFYREEIQAKIGNVDYHIGLPQSESYRVARLSLPGLIQRISEYLHNPKAVNYVRYIKDFMNGGLLSRVEKTPEWLRFVFEMTLNNPELHSLEQGAVLGIGTARALASIFQNAIMNCRFFQHKSTLTQFLTPFVFKPDIVTGAVVERGNGLMFSPFTLGKHTFVMRGHAGVGGQNIKFDPEHELVFCYLSNGLKAGFGDSARTFVALRDAIYTSVVEQEST
ncbi:Beta-lactamase-related domain containing protein [Aphelenchoides besseyi]|nr:Beta-lactamase-related domain containing protein [Aphelenchoides besseyi]